MSRGCDIFAAFRFLPISVKRVESMHRANSIMASVCRRPARTRAAAAPPFHFSFCLVLFRYCQAVPTSHKRCCARDAKRQTKMSFGGRGRGFGGRSPGRGGRFGGRGGRGGRGRGEEGPPDEVVGAFCVLEELGPHLICSQLNCLFAVLPEPNAVIFL